MKRHISIFAFLLGAFVAGLAPEAGASQTVYGGFYYIGDSCQDERSVKRMAVKDSKPISFTVSNLAKNGTAVFKAYEPIGMKISDWGVVEHASLATSLITDPTRVQWKSTVLDEYKWQNEKDVAQGAIAVRFDYIKYTLKFTSSQGGTMPADIATTYEESVTIPAPLSSPAGYHFVKWIATSSFDAGFSKDVSAGSSLNGEGFGLAGCHADGSVITLTAQWTVNTYTVTFDGNGGGSPNPSSKTVTYDSTYGDLATCSRTGYTFAGWWTAASGGTKIETTTKVTITGAQTLYAHWAANEYTVTVVPNGGTGGSCPNYTVSTAQQTKNVTLPTRTGYSISGWTVTGGTGGTPTVAGTTLKIPANVSGNLTLTPSWTPNPYTITYSELKEGSTHSGNPTSYTIESDDIVFRPASDTTAYKFNGWSPASIAKGSTGNLTVTANYLAKIDYPVAKTPLTYSGSVQSCASSTTQYQAKDNQQTVPGQYAVTFELNTGYCWSDGKTGSYSVPWEIRNADLSNVSVKQSGSLVYTGKAQTPTVFHQATAVGQKTVTWTYSASGSDFSPVVPSFTEIGEHTVYYRAEAEYHNTAEGSFIVTIEDSRYTIEFDGAGGSGSMEPVTLVRDEPYVVANAFTKKGCEFVTWRTVIGGVATNFDIGVTVSNLTSEAGTVITFTADWLGRYTVAFDKNGGEGTMTNVTYEADREYQLPSNAFTRSGYHFTGWATNGTEVVFTNCAAVSNLAAPGETNTLFAQWKQISLAEAMHCDNLKWDNVASGGELPSKNKWTPEVFGAQQTGTSFGYPYALTSEAIEKNGTLSFDWKTTGGEGTLVFWVDESPNFSALPSSYESLTATAEGSSHTVSITASETAKKYVHVFNRSSATCIIDQMTWTPEGAHPEPVDGKDNVTISSAAVSDGKFVLSFDSKAEFDYNLLTNADLLVDSWGVMGEKKSGDGKSLTFEPEIIEGLPQLFYKVETIQRK